MMRARLVLLSCAAFVLCASCATYNTFPKARVGKVDEPADLNNLIEDGKTGIDKEYVIVDVRSVQKYAEGHIPTAVNIPNGKTEEEGVEAPEKDKYIIVYCETGGRAQFAAKRMAKAGYGKIYNWGSFDDWPFEKETSPELLEESDKSDESDESDESDDSDDSDKSDESDESDESDDSDDDFINSL